MQEYVRARTQLIDQGLLRVNEGFQKAREFEDVKRKFDGSPALRDVYQLLEFPIKEFSKVTFLG